MSKGKAEPENPMRLQPERGSAVDFEAGVEIKDDKATGSPVNPIAIF